MNSQRIVSILVFVCGVLVAAKAYAQSGIQADELKYNTPRTHFYSIVGGEFMPVNSDKGFNTVAGGRFFTDNGNDTLVAGLHLPDGARFVRLCAYVYDFSATGDLSIKLVARVITTGTPLFVRTVSSIGFIDDIRVFCDATVGTLQTVEKAFFTYEVGVSSGAWPGNSGLRVHSVVVEYTIDEAD